MVGGGQGGRTTARVTSSAPEGIVCPAGAAAGADAGAIRRVTDSSIDAFRCGDDAVMVVSW
jgi:hypothetical protein